MRWIDGVLDCRRCLNRTRGPSLSKHARQHTAGVAPFAEGFPRNVEKAFGKGENGDESPYSKVTEREVESVFRGLRFVGVEDAVGVAVEA